MSAIRSTGLLALTAALITPAVFAADKPDLENGKTIFAQRCGICHATTKEGGPILGPNMIGLLGRKSASEETFTMYTPALKAYNVKWSEKTLSEFLLNPMSKVPGTTMPMMLPDDKERTDVIAYLVSLK